MTIYLSMFISFFFWEKTVFVNNKENKHSHSVTNNS